MAAWLELLHHLFAWLPYFILIFYKLQVSFRCWVFILCAVNFSRYTYIDKFNYLNHLHLLLSDNFSESFSFGPSWDARAFRGRKIPAIIFSHGKSTTQCDEEQENKRENLIQGFFIKKRIEGCLYIQLETPIINASYLNWIGKKSPFCHYYSR